MNDKYLKIYRYPKGTIFNQVVKVDKFEPKEFDALAEAVDMLPESEPLPGEPGYEGPSGQEA